jgi:hypothetical protein
VATKTGRAPLSASARATALKVVEELARQRHRNSRKAQVAGPNLGLGTHSLAGLERGHEQAVGQRSGRLIGERRVVGTLDLALHLRLADDHRLQPGGDAIQVTGRVAVAVRVDRLRELGRADPRLGREHAQRDALGLYRIADDQI